MVEKTMTNWESAVWKNIDLLIQDNKGQPDLVELPNGKISDFSLELALNIFSSFEKSFSTETVNGWIEKVRKYIEINRPKLILTSAKRFGGSEKGGAALEAMGTLMALIAFTKISVVHYNATSTVFDSLQKTYSEKQFQSRATLNLISQVSSNPQYFIGQKYEL